MLEPGISWRIEDPCFSRQIDAIGAELARAKSLHTVWPKDVIHQAAIVGEEAGELIQASLQHRYEGVSIERVRREAIHTAAMAVRLLMNLPEPTEPQTRQLSPAEIKDEERTALARELLELAEEAASFNNPAARFFLHRAREKLKHQ